MSYDPYLDQQRAKEAKERGGRVEIEPTHAARRWLELKFGLFLHFGINTFHDVEWSDGSLDPATFDPKDFDADQWCEAAVAGGVRFLLLTAKHHDGFCLWPSRWTDYCVAASPRKIDVIAEVTAACGRHGLKLGLYYSLWDRRESSYEHDRAYTLYMKRQLTELLTRYGEVVELWFDGGWKKGGVDRQDEERWGWREIYEHIKSIQPDCMVANNGTTERPGQIITWPCDFRCYEKRIPPEDDRVVYYCGGLGNYLPAQCEYTLSTGAGLSGQFTDGKWFWHADDHTVQSPEWVVVTKRLCNERGANFVINAGPSNRGLLREEDVACLRAVGKRVMG